MNETKPLPEDIAAASVIISGHNEGQHARTWQEEVDIVARCISASRPPMVARLVSENARLREALDTFLRWSSGLAEYAGSAWADAHGLSQECHWLNEAGKEARSALQPAPVLEPCECIDSDAWVCFRGQNIVGMDECPCPCHRVADPTLDLGEIERTRVYVASKVKYAAMWRELRANGVPIISTWIDEAGEGQTSSYAELSARCFREIASASSLVLYCEPGEVLKGALIEAGAALAVGVTVYCVGDCASLSRVFREHPLWHDCESVAAALAKLREVTHA